MMTNVVDCEFDALEIGMALERRVPPDERRRDDRPVPAGGQTQTRTRRGGWLVTEHDWSFPFEEPLHEVFPALHDAQSAWLSQIDSLSAPDRKTHELIRLVCTVILRNPAGRRAARAARARGRRRAGTRCSARSCSRTPAFGMLAAVEAMPARARGVRRRAGRRGRLSTDGRRVMAEAPPRPVPHPARVTDQNRCVLDRRRERRAAVPAVPGLPATTTTRRRRICPVCHSKRLEFEAVSGRATLLTYTVNHQRVDARSRAAVRRRDRRAPRAGRPAADDQPRQLRRPTTVEIGMPVRGDVRTRTMTCGSRCSSRRLHERRREHRGRTAIIERRAVISGAGQSDDRPAPVPRPARAHARRVPRGDRGRRAHHRGHRRRRDLSRTRWACRPGSRGAGVVDVQDALRLELGWWSGGIELPGQLGSVDQRVPRGRVRPRDPRPVLPQRLRGQRAGRQGPRRRHARRRRRRAASGAAASWSGRCRSRRRRPRSGSR